MYMPCIKHSAAFQNFVCHHACALCFVFCNATSHAPGYTLPIANSSLPDCHSCAWVLFSRATLPHVSRYCLTHQEPGRDIDRYIDFEETELAQPFELAATHQRYDDALHVRWLHSPLVALACHACDSASGATYAFACRLCCSQGQHVVRSLHQMRSLAPCYGRYSRVFTAVPSGFDT